MSRGFLLALSCVSLLSANFSPCSYAQGTTNSSLTGTILDASGGVIPGATVQLKNKATSQEFSAQTIENGTFTIPALIPGTYTAIITATGFKQHVLSEVKLTAATPASIRVTLEAGTSAESVLVQAGVEMVQSQTATISTTMEVTQISSLPLQARNVIYFLAQLPGVSSAATASPRNATINGLPAAAYNITIDGLNTQDNMNKNADGFFSFIYPSLDAIQEVTLSTAAAGAESAGQGAIQVKFVTRQGSNEYHGSLYWYHRNPKFNSNYWFNNRNQAAVQDQFPHAICGQGNVPYDPNTCHAPRDRVLFNQFGGRIGGPITIPGLFSGKDQAFFFVNFENFRLPNQISRNRTIMNPLTQAGAFQFNTTIGGQTSVQRVNILDLAAKNGQVSTIDPIVGKLLSDIRSASSGVGGIVQQSDPNLQTFTFANYGIQKRYYPTVRFDFNITAKHHLENTWNYQSFFSSPDTLNGGDPAFPGFPNYGGQYSNRFSDSIALRSTLKPTLVNELRGGLTGGTVLFLPDVNAGQFANQGGFNLGLSAFGNITNPTVYNAPERRNAPVWDVADTLTWIRGSHNLSLGAQFTRIQMWIQDNQAVPGITFGLATGDPSASMFTNANFPGASSDDLTSAQNLYAVLTGRVSSIDGNAYLDEKDNRYKYLGYEVRRSSQDEWGFFLQDSWRPRPNLTVNYGLRYEMQRPFTVSNGVYSTTTVQDIWGVSGVGNLFKPGTLTGKTPQLVQFKPGDSAYGRDKFGYAPNFGFAWSPEAQSGILGRLLGRAGQTVFRGGYSISFNRQGSASFLNVFDNNPGLYVNAARSASIGNLVTGTGTDVLPVLLRQTDRLKPPSFSDSPVYPMKGLITDQINLFEPNLRTPYTQSWTFGMQRELTKNTVLEARYVHNLNLHQWVVYNFNEVNIKENGFLDEFKNAMANLQANIAAGRGNTFKYAGSGTGTVPLPIFLAYFSGVPASQSGDATRYTSPNFSNSNFYNSLAAKNPSPYTVAGTSASAGLQGSQTFRNNALRAGLFPNFFVVNPDYAIGGANVTGNGGSSRYDAMQIELRHRMTKGLLLNANYSWAKGYAGVRYSFRQPWVTVPSTNNGGTLKHQFKMNWVYDLPVGKGRRLLGSPSGFTGRLMSRVFGGWEWDGMARVQSGAIMNLGNVNLVGMTQKDLQDAYGLVFDNSNKHIWAFPQDIRDNTYRAFNTSATSATGYSSSGAPSGRYIAPANSIEGCIQVVTGDCAPQNLFITGPRFLRFDMSAIKRIRITESANVECRAEFLNAFNNINFLGNTNMTSFSSSTFAEVTSAYRDVNNTQDPGGRLIQFVLRINF
jgi:hypothetical protein